MPFMNNLTTHTSLKPLVVFAHGKESGPWGGKIRYLADIATSEGAEVLSPDYSDLPDASARVERLVQLGLPAHAQLIFVGSSMGAYVATVASRQCRPDGLFLLAPAFGLPGYAERRPEPHACDLEVVMGWEDEVIPPVQVFEWAKHYRARLHLLSADHRLNAVLDELGGHFRRFLKRVLAGEN